MHSVFSLTKEADKLIFEWRQIPLLSTPYHISQRLHHELLDVSRYCKILCWMSSGTSCTKEWLKIICRMSTERFKLDDWVLRYYARLIRYVSCLEYCTPHDDSPHDDRIHITQNSYFMPNSGRFIVRQVRQTYRWLGWDVTTHPARRLFIPLSAISYWLYRLMGCFLIPLCTYTINYFF